MANCPEDREDLLAEATALVERAEFTVGGSDESYVIGYRRDGSISFFLGVDPVYQFNKSNELRRAYRRGFLIKAENGRLVRLQRNRTQHVVELIRHEFGKDEHVSFMDELVANLRGLREKLEEGDFQLIGQVFGNRVSRNRVSRNRVTGDRVTGDRVTGDRVTKDRDVIRSILHWLSEIRLPPTVASTPRVGRQ